MNPMMAYDNNSMAENLEAKPKVVKGVTKFMYTDKHTGEKYTVPDFDEPARELFVWSVLMNRLDMAMLFWDEGKVCC